MSTSVLLSRFGAVCLTIILFLLGGSGYSGSVLAQSPPVARDASKEVYVCPAEQAIVGLIVTHRIQEEPPQTRYANGLLLRCDGFVLAPTSVLLAAGLDPEQDPEKAAKATHIEVVLSPGTPQEQRLPARFPPLFGKVSAGSTTRWMPYTVLTFDKQHRPATRTLLADALDESAPLTVAWSAWDAVAHRFLPVRSVSAQKGASAPEKESIEAHPSDGKGHSDLNSAMGNLTFAQPIPGVTLGGVVIGPESLAVGLVTSSENGQSSRFTTFERLDRVTNCITPLSSTDGQFPVLAAKALGSPPASVPTAFVDGVEEELNNDPTPEDPAKADGADLQEPSIGRAPPGAVTSADMVYVPGGPVHLLKGLLDFQPDMHSSDVAYVAPFLIDRFEVTNAQYLAFWKTFSVEQRKDPKVRQALFPLSWSSEEPPFPKQLENVPVLGVPLSGAKAYAHRFGKRLPTPYEWCLAAFGADGGRVLPKWVKEYAADRQKVGQQVVAAHLDYIGQHPELVPRQILPDVQGVRNILGLAEINMPYNPSDGHGRLIPIWDPERPRPLDFARLPWFFRTGRFRQAAQWSRQTVLDATEPLWHKWIDPLYVLPVGSRRFDVSPYGAYDMILNGAELVAQGPFLSYSMPAKFQDYPADQDRYIQVALDAPIDYASMLQRAQAREFLPNDFGLWGTREHWAPSISYNVAGDPDFSAPLGLTGAWDSLTQWSYIFPVVRAEVHDVTKHGLTNLTGSTYETRIPSRRLLTGAMQAPGDPIARSWADQKDWTNVSASLGEASAMLRPIDGIHIDLVPGPRYQQQYWPAGALFTIKPAFGQDGLNGISPAELKRVVLENTVPATHTFSPRGSPREPTPDTVWRTSVAHAYEIGRQYSSVWLDSLDSDAYADATFISLMDSFDLWNGSPRHLRREMGRDFAIDVNRTPHVVSMEMLGPGPRHHYLSIPDITPRDPDVYLLAGGFRCVR